MCFMEIKNIYIYIYIIIIDRCCKDQEIKMILGRKLSNLSSRQNFQKGSLAARARTNKRLQGSAGQGVVAVTAAPESAYMCRSNTRLIYLIHNKPKQNRKAWAQKPTANRNPHKSLPFSFAQDPALKYTGHLPTSSILRGAPEQASMGLLNNPTEPKPNQTQTKPTNQPMPAQQPTDRPTDQ